MAFLVLLSGGVGSRMRLGGYPKQYLSVAGRPILINALMPFENNMSINRIVIVADKQWRDQINVWILQSKIKTHHQFADPGTTRQSSILNGLKVCADDPPEDNLVVIHDGVRPLVTDSLLDRCLKAADGKSCVLPVLPMKDTVYFSKNGSEVDSLLERDYLYAGQAPEVFPYAEYLRINEKASAKELEETHGSAEIAQRNGMLVHLIPGEEDNIKITTQYDLKKYCDFCSIPFVDPMEMMI